MSRDQKLHARPASAVDSASVSRHRSSIKETEYQPRTELGRELWELRQKIVAAGESLLDAEEIEREVARRRGGVRSWD